MIPAGADPDLASVASETTTSASPAKDGPPANDVPKRRGLVQPPWLKPAVVIGVTTAHIVVMAALSLVLIESVTPVADIAVELMPEGETVTEVSVIPTPDAASVVSQDQSNATSPDPPSSQRCRRSGGHDGDGADGDSAGNRPVAAEDHRAGLRSSAASKQERKKKHNSWLEQRSNDKTPGSVVRRGAPRRNMRSRGRGRMHACSRRTRSLARRAGVRGGSGSANHMSNAAYVALVSAEINRHKFIPPARALPRQWIGRRHLFDRAIGSDKIALHNTLVGEQRARRGGGQCWRPPPAAAARRKYRGSTTIHFNFER